MLSFPAILLNIGADISAIGAVSNLLIPQIPSAVFSIVLTLLLLISVIKFTYKQIASVMKWLCIAFFAYFVVPFLISQNWPQVLINGILPTVRFDKNFILILVAIFGTTISPYLFFWQTSSEVEEMKHRHLIVNTKVIHDMVVDVDVGMIFSNVIMFFIILTTGTVLFNAGITNINTVDQAALALRPLAGNLAYLLFAMGVIGSGFIAIPVLAGSLSYIYAEIIGHEESLDKKFHQAKGFYSILIISLVLGIIISLIGISPIKILIYTAVLYGLIAPFLIGLILHICNNRSILGKYVNKTISNTFGIVTLIVMSLVAVAFLYLQFMT